jgi:hypothetical protein
MWNRFGRLVRWTWLLGVTVLLGAVGAEAGTPAKYDGRLPLTLTALAVDESGVAGTATGTVDITIERWSTKKEAAAFRDTVVESGSEALLKWLEGVKPRVGYIRIDGNLGWDIRFAQYEERPSGGARIILVTDRPMSYWERAERPRSANYEFIFCDVRLDKKGQGQGKLASAAQIRYSRLTDQIEMENYNIEPVRLQNVRVLESGKGKGA